MLNYCATCLLSNELTQLSLNFISSFSSPFPTSVFKAHHTQLLSSLKQKQILYYEQKAQKTKQLHLQQNQIKKNRSWCKE